MSLPVLLFEDGGDESDTERFVESYKRYVDKNDGHPRIVFFGDGSFITTGWTFDEAQSIGEGFTRNGTLPTETLKPRKTVPGVIEGSSIAAGRGGLMNGRIAVVTGGAQGIGEQIVRELVAGGCFVFIADLNLAGAGALAKRLNEDSGGTISLPIEVDVTREDSVSTMIAQVVERVGGLDLFISNAGILKAGSVKSMDLVSFELVTKVNYTAFFLCVKHVAPVLAKQNLARGASGDGPYFTDIIQINSKSGLEGSNKNGAYAGGKFGGIGLTQSFALELLEDNIKVNAICPGNFFEGPLWSDSEGGLFVQYLQAGKVPGAKNVADVRRFYEDRVPMKRGCGGKDLAKAIYYIVDQKYETGQSVPVTGGQVMLR